MKFSELKSLSRAYVPQAKASAIDNTLRDIILNEGALDVAFRTMALKTSGDFDAVADQQFFRKSDYLDRFLLMDQPGLWWNDGNQWKQLIPKTIKWLDERIPNWRDADSGSPIYYVNRNEFLMVHPSIETAGADILKAYFIQRPATMGSDDHYPFHEEATQTEELGHLAPLSELVLMYWEWKALKILGKKEESFTKRQEYLAELASVKQQLDANADIMASPKTRLRGRMIGR